MVLIASWPSAIEAGLDEGAEDSMTEEQYEAIDQAFQAAEEACASLLPEGVTLDDLMADFDGEFCDEGHFDEDMDSDLDEDGEDMDGDLDGEDLDEPVEEPAAG